MIRDVPRKLVLRDVEFTEGEIDQLVVLFPVMDMVQVAPEVVRSNQILQKALLAGAVVCNSISTPVVLNLTQDGRALLAKV